MFNNKFTYLLLKSRVILNKIYNENKIANFLKEVKVLAVKIGVISLGCEKNRIDTEIMLGILADEGYEFVANLADADIALINTCSFTTDAKEESINAILEAEQQKRFGTLKGIIVTGCLPERYRSELKKLLPRVDGYLGVTAYKDIVEAVAEVAQGKKYTKYSDRSLTENFDRRFITTNRPTAYVKIAEGCDNKCSYCAIPGIRGDYQSRPIEKILEEIENLTADGYSEIILIAQDTTRYGHDLYNELKLAELLDRAAQIDGVKWLRILYLYPDEDLITDELLDVMNKHDNIVKYIDMPIQHMDNDVLKSMNRHSTYKSIMNIVEKVRSISDDFVLRTTVMVGFPGETREHLKNLTNGLHEAKFDNLGVFAYSREEETPAAQLDEQVDEEEKDFRKEDILSVQTPISLQMNKKRVGKELDVLIEGLDDHTGYYYGRSYAQIPDVDGKVLIKSAKALEIGKFYKVKITRAYNYDIVGEIIGEAKV